MHQRTRKEVKGNRVKEGYRRGGETRKRGWRSNGWRWRQVNDGET